MLISDYCLLSNAAQKCKNIELFETHFLATALVKVSMRALASSVLAYRMYPNTLSFGTSLNCTAQKVITI